MKVRQAKFLVPRPRRYTMSFHFRREGQPWEKFERTFSQQTRMTPNGAQQRLCFDLRQRGLVPPPADQTVYFSDGRVALS